MHKEDAIKVTDSGSDSMSHFLAQFETPVQNRMMVEVAAEVCGLQLSGFLENEDLELYFDITQGGDEIGFIAKGPREPGFRLGDIVTIEKWQEDAFRATTSDILRYCAVSGITATLDKEPDEPYKLFLGAVIYSEGFNPATFSLALEALHDCVERVRELSGSVE